jgi:hypothetical protein
VLHTSACASLLLANAWAARTTGWPRCCQQGNLPSRTSLFPPGHSSLHSRRRRSDISFSRMPMHTMRRHSRMRSSRGGVLSGMRCHLNNLPRSRASWPCAATSTDSSHACDPNAVNRACSSGAASKQSARVALERADAASRPVFACANRRSRRRARGLRISTSISSTSTGVRILAARCRRVSRRASR